MKSQMKWVVLATALIFFMASAGMVCAQQRDQMQQPQQQQQQMGRDTGASNQNIYDILKTEHNKTKDLLSKLGDSKDPQKSSQLMAELRTALVPHMKAEERTFYPALEKSDRTRSLALQAEKEHKAAEKILNEMAQMKGNDPAWQARYNMLNQSVRNHIRNEEGPLFIAAKKVLNEQQAQQIARQYINVERQVASQMMASK